jgi:hypothetical protein
MILKTWINTDLSQNAWAVYTITAQDNSSGMPDFAWYCKHANVIAAADAIKNPDWDHNKHYLLDVVSLHKHRLEASNALSAWIKAHGWPPLNLTQHVNRHNPVKCEQTGQTFRNAAEACSMLGINRSQMSQHLRKTPGYKTIKGLTFTNVSSASHVTGGKPLQPVQYPPVNPPGHKQ